MLLYGRKWRLGYGILKSCGRRNQDKMDLERFLLDLLELSISLLITARESKDTSDFKHFKTLIKSLKVLLPFYFLLSQLPTPRHLFLLLSLRYDSAHFRHQTRLKRIRAKQMRSGFPRKLWQDNEVDCAGAASCRIKTPQKTKNSPIHFEREGQLVAQRRRL